MGRQLTIHGGTHRSSGEETVAWRPDPADKSSTTLTDVLSGEDVESLRSCTGMLIVTRGPNTGSQIRLDRPVMSAGRHQFSEIYLDDITVSRRHAEIRCEDGKYRIVDCGSRNSTYVNGQPVDTAGLSNRDEIQIGKFRLVFVGPDR